MSQETLPKLLRLVFFFFFPISFTVIVSFVIQLGSFVIICVLFFGFHIVVGVNSLIRWYVKGVWTPVCFWQLQLCKKVNSEKWHRPFFTGTPFPFASFCHVPTYLLCITNLYFLISFFFLISLTQTHPYAFLTPFWHEHDRCNFSIAL